MTYKIAIVGGGPAGVICAALTCQNNEVTIFEKDSVLKTLLPTGGGRCNLTYDEHDFKELAKFYPRGEKFLYSTFSRFGVPQTLDYFNSIGIQTYIQEDRRIFPSSNSSLEVRSALLKQLKNVKIIKKEITKPQELEDFDKVVIATGHRGGYELSKLYNHTLIEPKAALCGFITEDRYPSGVSLNIYETKTKLEGDILFTHRGVSGPLIYKISSLKAFDPFPYELNFKLIEPDVLFKALKNNGKKEFVNVISSFMPKSLAASILKNPTKQSAQVTKQEIEDACFLKIKAKAPVKDGETVMAGGVCLDEINSKTLQSKINPNLYFCGEILNIDGLCGGFNLQACWSSGAIVAEALNNRY